MIEINIQMPKKCGLCPCFHFDNPMYCQAVKVDKNKEIVNPYGAQRPVWCPLKEQETVVAHWADDTGHWIEGDRNGIDQHTRTTGEMIDTFRCSWCGFYQYWKTPFCPNCGAKMEGQ